MKSVSQLSRRFRVAFDDTKTVPFAGLVIPLRLADQLGVTGAVNRRVGGCDRGGKRNGGDKALTVVAMLIAGGEFLSDVAVLAAGSTMQRLGYRCFSQSRLGEWLRSLTNSDIAGFGDALTAVTAQAWREGWGPDLSSSSVSDPLIVDLDSTHTETYGVSKDGAAARNYVGKRGYHPLLAVEASTGQVIAARLRPGNTSPANSVADFAAETLRRIQQLTGESTKVLLRADSGFYLKALFDHCVATDTWFSVTVRQHRGVRHLIDGIDDQQWVAVDHTTKKRVDIAAVPFEIKGRTGRGRSPIACRLVVRRVTTPADTGQPQTRLFDLVDYHAFVTNQPGNPVALWNRHRHRAVIEATIRDLKHGLGLNHFPSGSFTANAGWLHLNTLAHNLCRFTNHLLTTQPLTTKTLRYRYLTLPGRITTGSRTTTLHLPTHWPQQHHISSALTTINHPHAA